MLDKDKLILIYYYGFDKHTDVSHIISCINACQNHFQNEFDTSIKAIVLPHFENLSHKIEYINRDKLNEDEITKLEKAIEDFKLLTINN